MATSKEQQGSEVYTNEDRKIIISLLNEYAEKLLNVCERIDKHQKRLRRFFLCLGGLICSVALLLVTTWVETFLFSDSVNASRSVLIFSLLFTLFLFIIDTIYDTKQKMRLLVQDGKILSAKLEKVIRAASQAQEHVLSNFLSRIELDLRLADAESAIQHYTVLMKTRKLL
jgi:UDP-N-acetylmuramyl pentapeptide phosphotransferase/UDP-N-acetylglucosamine-1-phosphate transferase